MQHCAALPAPERSEDPGTTGEKRNILSRAARLAGLTAYLRRHTRRNIRATIIRSGGFCSPRRGSTPPCPFSSFRFSSSVVALVSPTDDLRNPPLPPSVFFRRRKPYKRNCRTRVNTQRKVFAAAGFVCNLHDLLAHLVAKKRTDCHISEQSHRSSVDKRQ